MVRVGGRKREGIPRRWLNLVFSLRGSSTISIPKTFLSSSCALLNTSWNFRLPDPSTVQNQRLVFVQCSKKPTCGHIRSPNGSPRKFMRQRQPHQPFHHGIRGNLFLYPPPPSSTPSIPTEPRTLTIFLMICHLSIVLVLQGFFLIYIFPRSAPFP